MNQYPNLPRYTPPIYVDGIGPGNTYTIPPQLTPFGRFHEPPNLDEINPNTTPPGYSIQRSPQPDPRSRLQALISGLPDLLQRGQINLGSLQGVQQPFDQHHTMVNAAQNLARLLAQQHTAGLRRYQYNGRH